jgi:flavin-dependent dehydrogenase
MLETDLAIVGGGPAGTAAAITAALGGLQTVLLDVQHNAVEQPGETLPPGIEPLFRKLGVNNAVDAATVIRHEGHWSDWSGSRQFVRFGSDQKGPWRGYQIRRNELCQILIQRAKDVGVSVKHQWRAVKPIYQNSKVIGIETSNDVISSHVIIDASGASHWLARARGDLIAPISAPFVAWYGWAISDEASRFAEPTHAMEDTGWTWIAQIDKRVCAWVRLDSQSGGAVRLTKPESLRDFEPLGRERGADATWRAVVRHGGDGFLCVGDAGAVLDPASSRGVLRALMTGMAAAHHAIRVIRFGHAWRTEAAIFDHWVRSSFIRDSVALRNLYDGGVFVRRSPSSKMLLFRDSKSRASFDAAAHSTRRRGLYRPPREIPGHVSPETPGSIHEGGDFSEILTSEADLCR